MRINARRPVAALVLTLCALLAAAIMASSAGLADAANPSPPGQRLADVGSAETVNAAACPDQVTPPPPVDTSERAVPGDASPAPLPEPANPVGGTRMGDCGDVLPAGAPPPPTDIGFESWVIEDLDTGAVLAARDPHARQRPASLIKLLLALVTVRELDPNMVVVGTQDDANQEGTRVGIGPGGRYTVNQLVHALLMHSGNDVAYALAQALGGVGSTLNKMNSLARQLGALDTRAATPSGLDGPGMSTSAYDLAVIFRTALTNPLIADAVRTKQIPFPGFGGKPGFTVDNDNDLLTDYPGDLGGKTGYTDDAQQTYANAAVQGGHRIALVMLRGTNHLDGRWRNALELMDYAFRLEAAHTPAVGRIVDASPPIAALNARPAANDADLLGGKPATAMSTFGNVGGPLTVVAGAAMVLVGVLYWRRRRAKLARQAAGQRGHP